MLADHDLAGLEAPEVIERLDTMALADRPGDLMASVQPDAVVVTDDQGREVRLPMPEDQVYVSVAPYVDQTHECHFHSLTTCVGELGDESVDVMLTTADGEVLVDE
ncbi:CueP family metal-binding protein, partial [Nocardioides salarius]|uniref:CueP family metal-binding protein n=1 Tax=Nocardioides salarius TaxID=374513 RepID=UPI0030F7EBBA